MPATKACRKFFDLFSFGKRQLLKMGLAPGQITKHRGAIILDYRPVLRNGSVADLYTDDNVIADSQTDRGPVGNEGTGLTTFQVFDDETIVVDGDHLDDAGTNVIRFVFIAASENAGSAEKEEEKSCEGEETGNRVHLLPLYHLFI